MYVHWKNEFKLGNDLIDTQHRMLMMLCRKLDIAIKMQEPEMDIQRTIVEIRKFAEFHFVSEENLMREIGYPELEQHAKIHNATLVELQVAMTKIHHRIEYPDDFLHNLNSWLIDHIQTDDSKLAKFLSESVKRPIGENLYSQFLLAGFETKTPDK